MLERAARLEVRDFPTRKPVKRRGNWRYYQWNTVGLIRQIRALLYKQGYAVNAAPQDCWMTPMPSNTCLYAPLAVLTAQISANLLELDKQLR